MKNDRKIYLRSLGIAVLVEAVVLLFTLGPIADGFMIHSAAAAAQRPILSQLLGSLGLIFHFPAIIFAFWFPPLVPIVQVFIMSGLIYLRLLAREPATRTDKYKYIRDE